MTPLGWQVRAERTKAQEVVRERPELGLSWPDRQGHHKRQSESTSSKAEPWKVVSRETTNQICVSERIEGC